MREPLKVSEQQTSYKICILSVDFTLLLNASRRLLEPSDAASVKVKQAGHTCTGDYVDMVYPLHFLSFEIEFTVQPKLASNV